jgi:hypothetical protein
MLRIRIRKPVFRINDILVWIRIRIRGSMPLTNGSGSFYFHHWPSRCQQKTNFFFKVFLYSTFWRYFYVIFQRKKVKKKLQNCRNQGFSYCFCLMIEGFGSGSIPLTSGSGSLWPKNMWIRWIRIRNTAANRCCFYTWILIMFSRFPELTIFPRLWNRTLTIYRAKNTWLLWQLHQRSNLYLYVFKKLN